MKTSDKVELTKIAKVFFNNDFFNDYAPVDDKYLLMKDFYQSLSDEHREIIDNLALQFKERKEIREKMGITGNLD